MHIQLDKIEELIRVGLLPVSSLPVLKRALGYVERGMVLPTQERNAVYDFMEKFMGKVLKDPTLFRMFKQKISTSRTMKEEQMHEASTGVKQSSGVSDDIKAQVAADIAKRKAKKAEALKSAAKEMEGWKPDKKDVRKIYQKEEVEQLDEGNPENKAKKNAYHSKKDGVSYGKNDGEKKPKVTTQYPKTWDHLRLKGSSNKKWQSKYSLEKLKAQKKPNLPESVMQEEIELQKAPEGMLMSFAKIVKSKIRAGGKPTDGDKKLASRAKAELRRRRNVASKRMVESADPAEYSERIKALMQEFNVSSVDEMTEEQKAEFFSAI